MEGIVNELFFPKPIVLLEEEFANISQVDQNNRGTISTSRLMENPLGILTEPKRG
jgi:hypothetical protein